MATVPSAPEFTPAPESAPPPVKSRRNVYTVFAVVGALVVGIGVGYASAKSAGTSSSGATPQVTRTVTESIPGGTTTTTVTVTPSPPTPAGPATSIPDGANGVYVVGQDIQPGVYHTTGASSSDFTPNCYYALLASTDTSNIIDNNNVTGPATVTIGSGVVAFDTSGCAGWTKE